MIVKICPLCDSEMKKAHYCDVCRSFVWKPEVMDIHYNALSRGLGEEDCSYSDEHQQTFQTERQSDKKRSGDRAGQKKPTGFIIMIIIFVILSLLSAIADMFF